MKRELKQARPAERPTLQTRFDLLFKRRNLAFLLGVLLFALILNVLLFDPKLSTGGDNATYISLAKSIAEGRGYRSIYDPAEPAHTQCPFGLSLLLVPVILTLGMNFVAMKLLVLVMGLAVTYFFWRFLSEGVDAVPAVILSAAVLTAFNPDLHNLLARDVQRSPISALLGSGDISI